MPQTPLPTLDETRPVIVEDSPAPRESDPLLHHYVASHSSDNPETPHKDAGDTDANNGKHDGDEDDSKTWVETVQEVLLDGGQALVESAEGLQHGFVEQVVHVADALMEELHQADEDESFFLEMGLARNLSILPTDVVEVAQAASGLLVGGGVLDSSFTQADLDSTALSLNEDLEQSMEILAGLTRRLSLQRSSSVSSSKHPGEVEIGQPAAEVASLTTLDLVIPPPNPVSAYLLLATAVVSLSSIGPFLQLQHNCTSAMKVTWRTCGTACLLFPFCVKEIRSHGIHPLTLPQCITFLLSSLSYVVMIMGFVLSLQYTTVGNAVILSNSQALLLLLGKFAVGAPVTFLEGSGALLALVGAVLCSADSAHTNAGGSDAHVSMVDTTSTTTLPDTLSRALLVKSSASTTVLGDCLALLSGVGGVGYLVFAKAVRSHMKLYTFMFGTMLLACVLCVLVQVFLLRETVTLNFHVEHGVFGFLLPTPVGRLPVELLIVVVCNMFGTLGYVRAMQYFDNLVISVASLMEPVVAELMAALMGVSTLPGLTGWLGNALVALGTLSVVYPTPGKAASAAH